jgi:hypothetical protein
VAEKSGSAERRIPGWIIPFQYRRQAVSRQADDVVGDVVEFPQLFTATEPTPGGDSDGFGRSGHSPAPVAIPIFQQPDTKGSNRSKDTKRAQSQYQVSFDLFDLFDTFGASGEA